MRYRELKVGDKVYVWRNGGFVEDEGDPIIGNVVEIDVARGEVYIQSVVKEGMPQYVALLDQTYHVGTGPSTFMKEECEDGEHVRYEDVAERLDKLEAFVMWIARDYVESSHDKVRWQRDDYIKRAKQLIEEIYNERDN